MFSCRLSEKNYFFIVNFITFLRILLSLLFSFFILKDSSDFLKLFFVFILVVLSDFFDGKLARKWEVSSKFGSAFDVFVDFFFVFSSTIALNVVGYFPLWLIVVIVIKLFEFILTSKLLYKFIEVKSCFVFDRLGKFLALCFYTLPIFVLFLKNIFKYDVFVVVGNFLFSILFVLTFVSMLYRISFCFCKLKK